MPVPNQSLSYGRLCLPRLHNLDIFEPWRQQVGPKRHAFLVQLQPLVPDRGCALCYCHNFLAYPVRQHFLTTAR